MDIVYHALNDTSKGIIDASCCGAFPSDTQKNPKDCMAIQLRSGKEVNNNRRKERKEETEPEQEETGKEGEKSIQTEQPKGSNEQKLKEGVPTYTPIVPFPQRL